MIAIFESEAANVIANIAGGIILLGLVALVLALMSYARVRTWAAASGRIIGSEPGFALVQRFKTEPPRNQRVAKITYEFEAVGRTWRSGRILDTGTPGEDQVERLLASYPVGKEVTIRHDRSDPSKSALEINHPPKDLALGCMAAILIILVMAAIAIWLAESGFQTLREWFPDALLQAMIPTAIFGALFFVMFFYFMRRAAEVRRWPQATGKVTLSRVEEFTIRRDKPLRTSRGVRRLRQSFMPLVEYAYEVGGRDYTSRSIWPDTEVSGDRRYAERIAARYPAGKIVFVFYDPADP
ncbi:MAG: DUF3592 domain-containing protein, partial [Sphingobium sp.]